ncbi:MAG: hypothetical protein AB7K24_17600 [Gemmataceae bacterium]
MRPCLITIVLMAAGLAIWASPTKTEMDTRVDWAAPAPEVLTAPLVDVSPVDWGSPISIADYETTCIMRDAASRVADWGSRHTQLNHKVFTNNSKLLSQIFADDLGAVMCQGSAYYLHLNYLEAGYRSYLLGFQSEAYSHAMVLVEVARPDGTIALIVQDPTFNLSFVDAQGAPLSIFEIMTRLARRQHQAIIVEEGPHPEVDYLHHPSDKNPLPLEYVKEPIGPCPKNPGLMKYRAEISLAAFWHTNKSACARFCSARGLETHVLYTTFDKPLYVFKGYPMSEVDKTEADRVFMALMEHHTMLHAAGAHLP